MTRKIEMSQRYDGDRVIPVTVLEVLPCKITQIRTLDRDGYTAVQVGCGERRRITKAIAGHVHGLGMFRWFGEFRTAPDAVWEVGQTIDTTAFSEGDVVQVTATSKGKGFQGVVKRHRFHGQDATHGTKDQVRMPGSIGSTGPQRVFKGTRMAGRMGGDRVTVRNLTIAHIDSVAKRIEVRGAVPGARGSIVHMQSYDGYWDGAAVHTSKEGASGSEKA
ncbi:MAG: 50S ribosomal protein L3 [Candidatus Uhrbacteria bacterium]